MFLSTSRSAARSGAAAVAGLSLILGGVAAQAAPTTGGDSDARPAARTLIPAANAPLPRVDAKPYLMPRIPVWVTLGDGRDLAGVTVSVIDAKGRVVGTATTRSNGIAMLRRSMLPKTYSLEVTGGKAWKRLGSPALATGELLGSTNKVLFISPVTSVAQRLARLKGSTYDTALTQAKSSLSLKSWTRPYQFSQIPQVFDAKAFLAWAKKNGGVRGGLNGLAKDIAAGRPVPDFSPMKWDGSRSISTRGVATVGASVMEGVMTGAVSYGTEMALGTTLGFESPEDQELQDINDELKTISNQLTELQSTMDDLIQLMEKTDLDVLKSAMSNVIGSTQDQWTLYIAATKEDPSWSSYDADMFSYAKGFYVINQYMGEFSNLFGSSGYLADIYAYNDAPWWNQSDVNAISSTVDYYGTYQAQAAALLNESMNFDLPGFNNPYYETPNYVYSQTVNVFEPQNDNIYLSLPQSIDTATIVIPSTQKMYKIFPTTFTEVYGQTSTNYDDAYPDCKSMGDQVSPAENYPAKQTSTSTWNDTWTKVMPTGWTVQSNSIFSSLSPTRQLPASADDTQDLVTTYTLSSLVNGAPKAFAMVTTGFYPRAGFSKTTTELYALENFLFCYSSAVALANTSKWVTDFTADRSGTNVPAGTPTTWETSPIPVGVLGEQQGQFEYVDP